MVTEVAAERVGLGDVCKNRKFCGWCVHNVELDLDPPLEIEQQPRLYYDTV